MKWKLLAIAAVFIGFFALRLILVAAQQHEQPKAVNGIMDLRSWDPSSGSVISLRGDWTFYPGQLIRPGDAVAATNASSIRVPGGWDRKLGSSFGYGTYKLEILLPEQTQDEAREFGIQTSIIRSAHELYVNGQRLGGSGFPGSSEADTQARVMPDYFDFIADGNRLELVVPVSNFSYARLGGIFKDIDFGTGDAIKRQYVIQFGQNAIAMGAFLLCGLMFLMLYFFRTANRELLYFSLFFWMTLFFWLTHNERILFWIYPDIPYELQSKLQVLPSAPLFSSLLWFVRWMYPEHARPWVMKAAAAGVLVFTGLFALTEVSFFSRFEFGLIVFDFFLAAYSVYILLKQWKRGTPDSVFLIVAAGCIFVEGIIQAMYYMGLIREPGFLPIVKMVFVLIMAFILARRFFSGMKEVETLSKRLLVADRLKNDFLATASQELRLPLHGMINIAQVMMNEEQSRERQTERLSLLMATGRRMSHLLNDMLDLSKLNEGVLVLEPRRVDMGSLINGVTDVMRYLKDGSSVRFVNQADRAVSQVQADEHRLVQIMFHLFHYIVKWGAQGNVSITAVKSEAGGTIEIAIAADRSEAYADESGDQTPSASADFSLEISRKLLGLHQSELQYAETSSSLRMAFRLPASEEESTPSELPRIVSDVAAGRALDGRIGCWRNAVPDAPRILVVDDDPVSLRVMFDVLSQEKLDVTAVTEGDEALRLADTGGGWDLIVLEANLPRLSGYDLCRKIRERHSFYDLPVLFLTRRSQPAFLLIGFDAGANDYVTKPFDTSEFLTRTRTLLQMKRSVRERLDIEMALIQAQIKPHFLYNTLNTIASLSEVDPERTRELLADFGSYLQSCFDLRNLDRKVPFEREWELVQSYLNIERARFGSRIQVTYALPERLTFVLPPLTIQPIVENALRHGVLKKIEGGRIHIEVTEIAGDVRISVQDDGIGIAPAKRKAILDGTYRSGIGLVNVNRRLHNAYGHGLEINSEEGKGTNVSFRIPVASGKEESA